MGEQLEDAARPAPEDDRARLRRVGCRWFGRLARRMGSGDGGEGLSQGNGNGDSFQRGLAFGRKELKRVAYERKVRPDHGYPGIIVDHGSGLTYDNYAFGVESAVDPYSALDAKDRARYGPQAAQKPRRNSI